MCFRPPEVTVQELICPKCGAVNHPGDPDCYACGESLEGVEVGGNDAFGDGSAAGAPPVPGAPGAGIPKVPGVPSVPSAPGAPKVPSVPSVPSVPAAGGIQVPSVPSVPKPTA